MNTRTPRHLIAALAALMLSGGSSALGQPTMDFKPVPAESADRFVRVERQRAAERLKREARAAERDANAAPEPPAPPGDLTIGDPVPDPPEPPEVLVTETSGEIVRFGSDVHIESGQVVNGDVVAFGGDVQVDGTVNGSVTAMGGDVELGPLAKVTGDVVCLGGTLRESPGSKVGGQRVTAPRGPGQRFFVPMLAMLGTGFQVAMHLVSLLFLVALAWIIVKLAPGRTSGALETIRREPGASFVVGLLVWALLIPSVIMLAIVIAILCITIIGIPVAAAVALGYVAFLVVSMVWGFVAGATLVGQRLQERFGKGPATLASAAIWGVVAVHGLRIVGDLFHVLPMFGIFSWIFGVVSIVMSWVLLTLGAGALIRGEYRNRTVQDWWRRIRGIAPADSGDPMPPPPPPPPAPAPTPL